MTPLIPLSPGFCSHQLHRNKKFSLVISFDHSLPILITKLKITCSGLTGSTDGRRRWCRRHVIILGVHVHRCFAATVICGAYRIYAGWRWGRWHDSFLHFYPLLRQSRPIHCIQTNNDVPSYVTSNDLGNLHCSALVYINDYRI